MRIKSPAIAEGTLCICTEGGGFELCRVKGPFLTFHDSLLIVRFPDCDSAVPLDRLIPVDLLTAQLLLELSERLGRKENVSF